MKYSGCSQQDYQLLVAQLNRCALFVGHRSAMDAATRYARLSGRRQRVQRDWTGFWCVRDAASQ